MEQEQTKTTTSKQKSHLLGDVQSAVRRWYRARFVQNPWKRALITAALIIMLICFSLVVAGLLSLRHVGWIALVLICSLAFIELLARRHKRKTYLLLQRLDELVRIAEPSGPEAPGAMPQEEEKKKTFDPRGKTAVLLVNGFNGLGLHTLFSVIRLFGATFTNFVFLEIGVLTAKDFKVPEEVSRKKNAVQNELGRYVSYMRRHGYYALGYPSCGIDVVDEIDRLTPEILEKFPNAVFFGGQIVFPNAPFLSGFFHNYTIFAVQRRFYSRGIPVVILPVRVY